MRPLSAVVLSTAISLFAIPVLTGCADGADGAGDADAGDTGSDTGSDPCDDPASGVGEECTPGGGECVCDNVCGADLFSEPGEATGFACMAECNDDLPCEAGGDVCVLPEEGAEYGACVPTGTFPKTDFSTLLMADDAPQKNSDITPVDMVVDVDGVPWTVTWVVAIEVPEDEYGNPVVYIVFGGSPTGVVYRQMYVVVPRDLFAAGTIEQVNPDSSGPQDYYNYDIAIQDIVYGDGFESEPTEVRYVAGSLDGTLVLEEVGAACADSEPGDCEVSTGSIEGSVMVWNLTFPAPEEG